MPTTAAGQKKYHFHVGAERATYAPHLAQDCPKTYCLRRPPKHLRLPYDAAEGILFLLRVTAAIAALLQAEAWPQEGGGADPKDQCARAVGLTGQESRVEFLEQLRTGQASIVEFLEQLRLSDPCATPCSHPNKAL